MEELIEANQISVKDLLQSFINYTDVSQKTMKIYYSNVKLFFDYINWNTRPTREDVLRYKEYLITNYKATTVNARLIALKQFFKWAEYTNQYKNITENIKQVPIGDIDKNYPTLMEIKQIINSIKNNYDKALFVLLTCTGLRLNEVVNADIEDIKELHGENVLYVLGKGRISKDEYVKLDDSVYSVLKDFIGERTSGAIFLSTSNLNKGNRVSVRALEKRVKKIYRNAGIDESKFTCHCLRGSFSAIAMENGSNIYDISKVLRHKSIKTTEMYLRSLDRQKNKTENIVARAIL